jgi:hypothetical protein
LNSTKLQELIDDPNRKFDLIVMELLHPVLFGFAARFEAPSIGTSIGPLFSYKYDATGHLQHPGVYCDQFLNIRTLSLRGKFQSIAFFLWCKFYYQWVFLPRAHGMATKYFGVGGIWCLVYKVGNTTIEIRNQIIHITSKISTSRTW